jgi:hypothetical protein
MTGPQGTKPVTMKLNERTKFFEPYGRTNYLYLGRYSGTAVAGVYNFVITARGRAAITVAVGDKEIPGEVVRGPVPAATAVASPAPVVTPTATPTPTPTPTVTVPVTLPSMRLVSPAFGPSNSIDTTGDIAQYYSAKTRAFYTYIAAGTTLTLKYLVTSDGTKPLANKEVTLQVNAPYSLSKANWLSGSTKIGAPSAESASGADLKATTNAMGEVTFIIKNTDTTGTEAVPASPNAMAPKVRLYGTFKAIISGYGDKDADVDLVTFDVYAAPKPVVKATTITCVKGKTTKKVTAVNPKCPTGYKKK